MYQNIDLENETVEAVFPWKTGTVSLKAVYARSLMVKFMHWDGILASCLTLEQHNEVYTTICDGFGLGGYPEEYDWSHVRDSSYDACLNFGQWLTNNHKVEKPFDEMYLETLTWAKKLQSECDPIDFFVR